jgi:hypothetical protein
MFLPDVFFDLCDRHDPKDLVRQKLLALGAANA